MKNRQFTVVTLALSLFLLVACEKTDSTENIEKNTENNVEISNVETEGTEASNEENKGKYITVVKRETLDFKDGIGGYTSGHYTDYEYHANGKVSKKTTTSTSGEVNICEYNAYGDIVADMTYNSDGSLMRGFTYEYDDDNRLTISYQIFSDNSKLWNCKCEYSESGSIREEKIYGIPMWSTKNELLEYTKYTYDINGNQIDYYYEIYLDIDLIYVKKRGPICEYNSDNKLVKYTEYWEGNAYHDPKPHLIVVNSYDDKGNISIWEEIDFETGEVLYSHENVYEYDEKDNILSCRYINGGVLVRDNLYEYDENGNTTKESLISYVFNPEGDYLEYTEKEYDAEGNLVKKAYYTKETESKYENHRNIILCIGDFYLKCLHEYNKQGDAIKSVDYNPDGTIISESTLESEYDEYGNNTQNIVYLNGQFSYGYTTEYEYMDILVEE